MANPTLSDVFPSLEAAKDKFKSYGFDALFPADFHWNVFWSLINGRHGLDEISVRGEQGPVERWGARFLGILWQYGPAWDKNIVLQDRFRNLSEEELERGSLQIASQALNPAKKPDKTIPGIDMPIVETINAQSTNQYKKNKADAYSSLLFLLKNDVTEPFLRRFDALFKPVLSNAPCEECIYDGE